MRSAHVILFVVCLSIAFPAAADDLRVTCAPGLKVFVDGGFVGVCIPKYDGKVVSGLSTGKHTVRVEEVGFVPKEYSVDVGPTPTQLVFRDLVLETASGQPAAAGGNVMAGGPKGTIEIASNPHVCAIEVAGQEILKQEPIMKIPGIPAGDHEIRFDCAGADLRTKVLVNADETTRVTANILENQIDVHGDESTDKETAASNKKGGSAGKSGCVEYWVQVLLTTEAALIEASRTSLKEMGFPLYHQKLITITEAGARPLYKLRVGPIQHKKMARRVTSQMKNVGFSAAWYLAEECP